MITYFKMKRHEWKVKAMLYEMLVSVMDELVHAQAVKEHKSENEDN